MVISRERKSKFVKLFDKTPPEVLCPHFYELILSNGCPYDCSYCYLKLTFRGKTQPTLFQNGWDRVVKEIGKVDRGIFSTGELADSLAVVPPLLSKAIEYFTSLHNKFLLLVTKSDNIEPLLNFNPSNQIIVSFSVNSTKAAEKYEREAPPPIERIKVAEELILRGWRVRIRLDPIIIDDGIDDYERICELISQINPERITIGSLRQYPTLKNFAKNAPSTGLVKSQDGRMRYSLDERERIYSDIRSWLGQQPALCKETHEMWETLGWEFQGCNCTE